MEERVASVRAFDRFYTAVIGVPDATVHDTACSPSEARTILELAARERVAAADLRRLLGLDAGHVDRTLTKLEAEGLVTRERAAGAHHEVIGLTPAGREVFAALEARSAARVRALLAGLSEEEQERLVSAMGTIRRLLGDRTPGTPPYVIRPPRSGDFGWVVFRHGALYAREYGWGPGFEALVAEIVAGYVREYDPARYAGWIAEVDGERAGCVFCAPKDDQTAQLRMLLVEPWARGMGIGSRLVEECLRFATAAGYRRIMLWTRDVLTSARKIYQAAGFELVDAHKGEESGKEFMEQIWARDLR